jgi:serine/threonine protein kinase
MCTIPLDTLADIFEREMPHPMDWGPVRLHAATKNSTCSFDLSHLPPLPSVCAVPGHAPFVPPSTNDFVYVGRLGSGAFAQVYCVRHVPSEQYVAIKVADGTNEQARLQLDIERQILFRHSEKNPYIIKAYCTFHQGVELSFDDNAAPTDGKRRM